MLRTEISRLIPPYTHGHAHGWLPDGCGLSDDLTDPAPADECYIQVIERTTAEAFLAYCGTLAAAGWQTTYGRETPAGVYREMALENERVYLYYVAPEHTARLIVNNEGVSLAAFAPPGPAPAPGSERLMQFGLFYGDMVPGVTCDCGMLYALLLSNGEYIIIDGGEKEQATDEACAEVMARLRAGTGREDVTVALWLCTHPHNDHMDLFLKLLRVYNGTLHVKRTAFNFPSHSMLPLAPYISFMRSRLAEYAPAAAHLKLHTGQVFSLCGVTVEVLLTQEDVLHPAAERPYNGTNETSVVVKFTAPAFSFTVLADIPEENGDRLLLRCRHGEADCTFLQAAHHCINRIENVYRNVQASYVLIPEKTEVILRHDMRDNYALLAEIFGPERIFCAGDGTRVFWTENGSLQTRVYPVRGGAFDGSEL